MRLSIIVPIYKAENYLHKCIDSIVSQAFGNWELILIDDGSPDRSGEICDAYARRDQRIKVIHKQNEGVSVARNIGLEIAKGEYVTFIDSDDSIEGDCFGLLQNAENDLIVFESISYKPDGTKKYWYNIDERIINSSDEVKQFIVDYINVFVLDGPCGKFFKRTIIDDCRFPKGQSLGEDNVFMLSFIKKCRNIALKKGAYYVIFDHYGNDSNKYMMPANKALMCLENIMNAYNGLNMLIPSFEKRMFDIFYMVRDPKSNYDCWYKSSIVKDLERKYLHSESQSSVLYYYSGKCKLTKQIGFFLFWEYLKIRNVAKLIYSKCVIKVM